MQSALLTYTRHRQIWQTVDIAATQIIMGKNNNEIKRAKSRGKADTPAAAFLTENNTNYFFC